MDVQKAIRDLKVLYPGKKVFINSKENPTEVMCELESARINPDRSVFVAIIDTRIEHRHRQSVEEFEVIKGTLFLSVSGREYTLTAGRKMKIMPGQVHAARGNGAWIKITSTPGYIPTNMVLVE